MTGGPDDGPARVTGDAELSYQHRGPAAWITLNRPGQRNALTATMLARPTAPWTWPRPTTRCGCWS